MNINIHKQVSESATIKDIKPLIQKALVAQQKTLGSLESAKHNPTVASSYNATLGRIDALEAVLDAINGNTVNIKLLGV